MTIRGITLLGLAVFVVFGITVSLAGVPTEMSDEAYAAWNKENFPTVSSRQGSIGRDLAASVHNYAQAVKSDKAYAQWQKEQTQTRALGIGATLAIALFTGALVFFMAGRGDEGPGS